MKIHDSLAGFPHGDAVEDVIQGLNDVHGAIAAPNSDGGWRVLVFGPACTFKTEHAALDELLAALPVGTRNAARAAFHAWRRPAAPKFVRGTLPGSRTDRALQLLEKHPKMTPHEAATRIGVESSAVYRALQRRQRPKCECCGRAMP